MTTTNNTIQFPAAISAHYAEELVEDISALEFQDILVITQVLSNYDIPELEEMNENMTKITTAIRKHIARMKNTVARAKRRTTHRTMAMSDTDHTDGA